MRQGNLLVLSVLLAGVAIKSFGSSAPTRHANAIPTGADAAKALTPTMKAVPVPTIDVDAEYFVGAGDDGAGSWSWP